MAVGKGQEPFWRRHVVALIVGGFAALLVVIVAGQLLDQGDVAKWLADVPQQWAYVSCFLFVWFDAVIPIFPGETTLSAASTNAAGGHLDLGVVMLVGALGAIIGDSSLFWIARKSVAKVTPRLDKALENPKVRAGWDALDRSPGLLIMAGRYVPGDAFRRQRIDGSVQDALSALSPVVGPEWCPVVGVHMRAGLLGFNHARWLSAGVARHLLTDHVRPAVAAVYFVDRHKRRGGDAAKRAEQLER
jgi:hypothetical protein